MMALVSQAQMNDCGSDLSLLSAEELKRASIFYEKERAPVSKTNGMDSVAVSMHIIETVPGAANITLADLEREIEQVNRAFSSAGIAFFICGSPRFVRGESSYDFTAGDQLNASLYISNTINIYFADEVTASADQALCGYAQFPWRGTPETRYIMMNKSCATNGATLAHELGHFYGLLHTHETAYGREYVNGANCGRAGDQLCDTPADPKLNEPNMMRGCAYIGEVRDPLGQAYKPPVSNLMSYAPSTCRRVFSAGQAEIVRAIHENENAYLASNCDFYPDFAISTPTVKLDIRSDQDVTLDYTFEHIAIDQEYEVSLNVTIAETPEEDGFILLKEKVRLTPGQDRFSQIFEIDFPVDRGTGTYYLKAFLDSEYEVIERTESNNYATTTVTVDNSNLSDVVLFPNPVQDELKLFFRDRRAEGRMFIRIYRYDGRLVLEDEAFKNAEEFFKIFDVSWMSTGLYVVAVDFEKVNREYSFKFLKK